MVIQLTKEYSEKLKNNYPNMIPVILKNAEKISDKKVKTRFLVSKNTRFGQFALKVRESFTLSSEESLYFFTESNTIPSNSILMEELYTKHKNQDDFLILHINKESSFGFF